MTEKFTIIIPPQDIAENPACLQKVAEGDSKAFSWLYEHYCRRLYDYLLLLSANPTLAEDCVQEIFLKIWQSREKLGSVQHFNGYLFMIARNHLLNHWKKQQGERRRLQEFKETIPHASEGCQLEGKEMKAQYQAAVGSLPKQQQRVYRLIREEGMSREEVSRVLKISPLTVKCTMQNALKGVRERMRGKMSNE